MLNSKIILISLMVGLSSCGDYHPETLPEPNAMKEGAGLFSGKDGSFTLYASDDDDLPKVSS
ncbi:MAG: hypothetical protein KF798_00115 [Candidatus Paracaedibacteraceae bacterium]|nr:hypothetical protein [Candidatus Paracaedibacteraceae bacterium]